MEEGSHKFWRSNADSDNSDSDTSNASSEISDFLDQAGAQLKLSSEQAGLLLIAAARGISFVKKCLLRLGADPDVLDKDGLKPLKIAAAQRSHEAVGVLRPVTSEVQEVLTLQRGTGKHPRFHKEFEEREVIGKGGFGHVYLCRHKLDEKLYAVKKIAFSESQRVQLREVIAHSSMKHKHVVQYHQAWVEDGCFSDYKPEEGEETPDHTLFIQMELCGRTLGQIIEANQHSIEIFEGRAALFTRQILQALEHIHSQGFIHGDMSRDNVFFDEHEVSVKIGDFGFAHKTLNGEATVSAEEWGNPMYDPTPEEVDRNIKSFETDVFSTGLVLCDIWHKFTTSHERFGFFSAVRRGDLPPKIHPFIRSLLAYNPSNRPTIRAALEDFDRLFWHWC